MLSKCGNWIYFHAGFLSRSNFSYVLLMGGNICFATPPLMPLCLWLLDFPWFFTLVAVDPLCYRLCVFRWFICCWLVVLWGLVLPSSTYATLLLYPFFVFAMSKLFVLGCSHMSDSVWIIPPCNYGINLLRCGDLLLTCDYQWISYESL